MTTRGRGLAAIGLIVALTGCYEHTYTLGTGAPTGTLVYDHWQNHWLGGLIGEDEVAVDQLCPSGNVTIHNEQTFLNGLVSVLTGGIYAPTEVKVRCDNGRQAEVDLSADEVARIVIAPAFLERVEVLIPERFDEAMLGVQALEDGKPEL